jgi:hypothetical protein
MRQEPGVQLIVVGLMAVTDEVQYVMTPNKYPAVKKFPEVSKS